MRLRMSEGQLLCLLGVVGAPHENHTTGAENSIKRHFPVPEKSEPSDILPAAPVLRGAQ